MAEQGSPPVPKGAGAPGHRCGPGRTPRRLRRFPPAHGGGGLSGGAWAGWGDLVPYTRPRAGGPVPGIHLGDGYGPADIQAVIDGKAPTRTPAPGASRPAPQRVNLLIDIQEKIRQGKGPAYERWAKVYNLKQMAAALQFLQEHGLTDYDALAEQTSAAVDRFHTLAREIQSTEAQLSKTSDLMAAVVAYAKTWPVFDGYKAAKYSKKYLAQHEVELADYRAAKAAINELLDGESSPRWTS